LRELLFLKKSAGFPRFIIDLETIHPAQTPHPSQFSSFNKKKL